jgi:hypothetical protein
MEFSPTSALVDPDAGLLRATAAAAEATLANAAD